MYLYFCVDFFICLLPMIYLFQRSQETKIVRRVFLGHGARTNLPVTKPSPATVFLLRGENTKVMVGIYTKTSSLFIIYFKYIHISCED